MSLYTGFVLLIFCVYAILTLSASLTTGLGEMLTMCQAAFFGIGAYVGAFFLINFNHFFILDALVVMLVSGISSLFVSYASIKLKGDPFIIVTICFQMIVYCIIYNWKITGGDVGLELPSLKILGTWELQKEDHWILVILAGVALALSVMLFRYLKRMPYGRLLNAIRTDDQIISSYGKNVNRLKMQTFFISAALSGLAGLLYVSYNHYFHPNLMSLELSILVITALFIGGKGSWKGVFLGVYVVFFLRDAIEEVTKSQDAVLRLLVGNETMICNIERAIYGLLLIVLMFFRPQGLVTDKRPSVTYDRKEGTK